MGVSFILRTVGDHREVTQGDKIKFSSLEKSHIEVGSGSKTT